MSTTNEHYLGAVREHLGVQGASPERVGQHLEEMAGHLEASGASPLEEFGPPDIVARGLAQAEGLGSSRWIRLAVLTILSAGWFVVFVLFLAWNDPAVFDGGQVGMLAVMTGIGTFIFSTTGTKLRDHYFAVTPSGTRAASGVRWALGAAAGSFALSVVVELLIGDRLIGIESVRSWVAGLVVAGILAPLSWWANRYAIGRPRFPIGSPLYASSLTRRVRVSSPDRSSHWQALGPRLGPTVPMIAMFIVILGAKWLNEPYDLLALFGAVLFGPGWMIWRRRRDNIDGGPSQEPRPKS